MDLYVWHEPAPITADAAAAKVLAWRGGDAPGFVSHISLALLRAELLARFPVTTAVGTGPHADSGTSTHLDDAYELRVNPTPNEAILVLSIAGPGAGMVADAVRHGAKRHGLVCYDPREQLVDPNAPGPTPAPAFTLSSALMSPVADPDDALLEQTVRALSRDNFFAVLERADGWFVQVGYGPRAATTDGTYALEYQQGAAAPHLRCESTDVTDAVRLLRQFRAGDDSWRHRHVWLPLRW